MELKKQELPEQTIHFWYCDFNKNRAKLEPYYALLSEDEKARSGRFKFDRDKECYIISRGILRLLLAGYSKQQPQDLHFDYTPYGKPFLSHDNAIKFNISHSGNMAVFAFVRNEEIGIDVERIKDDFDLLELAQSFFSTKEILALEKQSKKDLPRAFYRCWTRKESFIKAEGSGLSFPLDQFAVSLENDEQAELLYTQWDSQEKEHWQLFSYVPARAYIAAVAIRSRTLGFHQYNWDA
ncbi:MAG: 4'-phosphopantetheinyl transferase superfamily protein [Maribacter sp.]|uniref:4'-phosphopantetheinyl transferase family protein n=1 Tax=Maribacter sp. TaxID=1897614 RepID=UPI003298D593